MNLSQIIQHHLQACINVILSLRGHLLLHQQKYLAAYATDLNSDQRTRVNHSRSQLRIYVICKADSKEPKNKSEFLFFKAQTYLGLCILQWLLVIRYNFPRCNPAGGH